MLRAFYDAYEVKEDTSKGAAGRPPFDPKMMLLLMFYCMFKRQFSSRAMEAFVQTDLGARLIVGGTILPDHSTFFNFRKRHQENLKEAFVEVLMLCVAAGKVDLKHVSADGTKFEANASRHSSVKVDEMEKLRKNAWPRSKSSLRKWRARMLRKPRIWGRNPNARLRPKVSPEGSHGLPGPQTQI